MIGPKVKVWRSEPYRRYVASQECFACRIESFSQAAHPNEGKGLGMKTDDSLIFPLCGPRPNMIGCHAQLDLRIDMDRDRAREAERRYVREMQQRAVMDGWKLPQQPAAAPLSRSARSDNKEETT